MASNTKPGLLLAWQLRPALRGAVFICLDFKAILGVKYSQ